MERKIKFDKYQEFNAFDVVNTGIMDSLFHVIDTEKLKLVSLKKIEITIKYED